MKKLGTHEFTIEPGDNLISHAVIPIQNHEIIRLIW